MCTNSLNLKPSFSKARIDHTYSSYNSPSIYVICKEAWGKGSIHGVWISALQSSEYIMADIYAMLSKSPVSKAEDWEIYKFARFGDCTLERNEHIDGVCSKARWAYAQKQCTGSTLDRVDALPRFAERSWHPSDENYSDVEDEDFFYVEDLDEEKEQELLYAAYPELAPGFGN